METINFTAFDFETATANRMPCQLGVVVVRSGEIADYVEAVLTDYNNINEDTRMQLELINETLAELQTKNKALDKPHSRIGFNAPQYKTDPTAGADL